ncbi:hypothetical protein OH76DRAFT_1406586 [Lentinus brumalis]|uniref:F-box domain-containing protein n=1 Tax=Lentinus brumalis TaxID=2498619 RepID=A0A371D2H5_9APHY|nr:hypothetical protein OH76DRAFT_1406586 [Polyporus brumalis]
MTAGILDLSPDLLTLMCTHCSSRSLINLATTCRALSEHASSQIWSTIPSFGTLAYTLPREVWVLKESGVLTVRATLSFTRPIKFSDLARFRKYAPYVKIVNGWGARFNLSPSAWDTLEDVLAPSCFPNLHSIFKYESQPPMVEPMHIFLCNTLRNLSLKFAPSRLVLWEDPVPDPARRWITNFFAGFPSYSPMRLVSFQVLGARTGLFPPSTLAHLAAIPTLQTLGITLLSDDFPDGVKLFNVVSPFPSLRTIQIETDSTLLCAGLLGEVCSSHIETLKVDSDEPEPVSLDDFHAVATVLANCPSAHVMKHLTLELGPLPCELEDPVPIRPDVFAIIHGLHALEEIVLGRGCYAALDDDALVATLEAWPQIRVAKLCSSETLHFGDSDTPRVTLSGLAAIAGRCQAIEAVEVPLADIDRSEVARLLTRKPPRIWEPVGLGLFRTCCPLKTLGVGPSVLAKEDIVGVAAVLSQWFPKLRTIYYLTPLSGPDWDQGKTDWGVPIDPQVERQYWWWGKVGRLIHVFASTREQEQKWRYLVDIDEALSSRVIVEHSDAAVQE